MIKLTGMDELARMEGMDRTYLMVGMDALVNLARLA